MSDILFVTWDGGGNVPPPSASPRELQGRGHTVRFLGHATQEEVRRGRHRVHRVRRGAPRSDSGPASPAHMMALQRPRRWARTSSPLLGPRPADVVVVDCLLMGAMDAARAQPAPPLRALEHLFDTCWRGWRTVRWGCDSRLRGLEALALRTAASRRSRPPSPPWTRARRGRAHGTCGAGIPASPSRPDRPGQLEHVPLLWLEPPGRRS